MRASSLSGSNMFLDCSFLVRLESTLERNYGAWKICNNLDSPGKHVLYLPICIWFGKGLDPFHLLPAALLCYIWSESQGHMFPINSDLASSNSLCTFWTLFRCSHNGCLHHLARLLQSLDRQMHQPTGPVVRGLQTDFGSSLLTFPLFVPRCQPCLGTQLRSHARWEKIVIKAHYAALMFV